MCDSGSTVGSYVIDEDGYSITTLVCHLSEGLSIGCSLLSIRHCSNDLGISPGQTQQLTCGLQYATIGVAILIGTTDNSTKVICNMDGTLGNVTSTATTTSSTGGVASAVRPREVTWDMIWMMAAASLIGLIIR